MDILAVGAPLSALLSLIKVTRSFTSSHDVWSCACARPLCVSVCHSLVLMCHMVMPSCKFLPFLRGIGCLHFFSVAFAVHRQSLSPNPCSRFFFRIVLWARSLPSLVGLQIRTCVLFRGDAGIFCMCDARVDLSEAVWAACAHLTRRGRPRSPFARPGAPFARPGLRGGHDALWGECRDQDAGGGYHRVPEGGGEAALECKKSASTEIAR